MKDTAKYWVMHEGKKHSEFKTLVPLTYHQLMSVAHTKAEENGWNKNYVSVIRVDTGFYEERLETA